MAETWTPQQRQAVFDRGGKLLVSAAAGSGKTKVLVDRLMAYLLDPDDPANMDDFLIITYTKAAAAELRGKISAKLAELIAQQPENRHLHSQMQRLYLTKISTVHAFCSDILRDYAYRLDLSSDFRVADENECREIRETVIQKLLDEAYQQPNEAFLAFVDSQGLGRDDRLIPEILQKVYDSSRCHLNPQEWLDQCQKQVDIGSIADAAQTVYGAYLIQRLHDWLDLQIPAMESCVDAAEHADGGGKVSMLLSQTVAQLQQLRAAKTWDEVCDARNVDFGRLVFSKQFEDEDLKERIKAVRDGCKSGLEKQTRAFADDSHKVLQDLSGCAMSVEGLLQLVEKFSNAYTQAKKNRRVFDFGDLEHKMLDLLLGKGRTGPTAVAVELGRRFREVMVDEYQDSNAVQDAIYGALTNQRQNLFLVGDVKQSIYQFRLADPGIFLEKYQHFVPAEQAQPGEGRKVLLSKNFRSGGGVLSACNDVFSLCMSPEVGGLYYGPDEALNEGFSHQSMGEKEVQLYCVDVQEHTYPEEAAFVADHIRSLLDGTHYVREKDGLRTIRAEDIAILLRSPGSAGKYFQDALDQLGIRYTTGGGVDLLQTEEIATLRSLLQAIHNPRLDIPLISAMASPLFGFSADDLARIRSINKRVSFYEVLCQCQDADAIAFVEKLSAMRQALRLHSLTGLLEEILIQTRMEAVYGAMEGGDGRINNIHAFYQLACEFESGGSWDLGRFLENLDAMQEQGLITAGEQSAPGCVTIMSIHKSKGLEFPVVFLCGLGRTFNTESQRANLLCHKEMGLGLSAVDHQHRLRYPTIAKRAISAKIGEEALSEELRVLYVAMTRARDRLIMTYASNRLEKDLTEMVQQMNAGCHQLLIGQTVCPGEWVLLTALHRTEAGELFALGGNPGNTTVSQFPWLIRVVTAPKLTASGKQAVQKEVDTRLVAQLRESIAFHYPHTLAITTPSKQTATQRKGRQKDEEAAEGTSKAYAPSRQWRKPSFMQQQVAGKEYGSATHKFMQYLDFAACETEEKIARELRRLVDHGYLTEKQAALVDIAKVFDFFQTEFGQKLRSGVNIIREFKFSVMEDGQLYDAQLKGEQVLLQGVVDCALIEDDGITVVDFKTDHVTEQTLVAVVDRYREQVRFYARVMERIYRKPVREAMLYFFSLNRFVSV